MPLSPKESLIALNLIPGLGSIRIQALLEFFGSAEIALEAPMSMLIRVPHIGEKLALTVREWSNCTNIDRELHAAEQFGVKIVTLLDEEYPAQLRRMSDPPVVLYVRGRASAYEDDKGLAIVGSRMATPYGLNIARRFGRELGDAGCSIISGLARGIDAAAHWGALDSGARTVGVLGSGQACFAPEENRELAERIIEAGGAVVSEYSMYMRPSRTSFPQRNRIVAAWSKACLVVEAPLRSGSLHTARISAEFYGNSVYAIPGPIDRPSSAGCNAIIRDGVTLCTSPQDIINDMRWEKNARATQAEFCFEETAQPIKQKTIPTEFSPIIDALEAGHNTLDALCTALGMPAHALTPVLMRMQIERYIRPETGARFAVI